MAIRYAVDLTDTERTALREISSKQYCGQNLGCLIGNDAIVTKRFVIRAGFFHTLPVG